MLQDIVHILLVEDDDVDAETISRAFLKYRITNPITRARDGIEALAHLRGDGVEAVPRPNIILLDLNMPRMGGINFLKELRRDDELSDSVVFVLTTSNADRDKASAYKENVSGYVVKSKVGDDFSMLIELMDCYWKIIELPTEKTNCARRRQTAAVD